jgi:nucleotide-binding universal stress UspA family protein
VPAAATRELVALADGNITLGNVLIPIDEAPDPLAAIEFARRASETLGDGGVTITLLHVGAATAVPRVRADDGAGWTFKRVLRAGDPVDQILAVAEEVRADLIVMPNGRIRRVAGQHDGTRAAPGAVSPTGRARGA